VDVAELASFHKLSSLAVILAMGPTTWSWEVVLITGIRLLESGFGYVYS
jgi:hypothetical protein